MRMYGLAHFAGVLVCISLERERERVTSVYTNSAPSSSRTHNDQSIFDATAGASKHSSGTKSTANGPHGLEPTNPTNPLPRARKQNWKVRCRRALIVEGKKIQYFLLFIKNKEKC